MTRRRPIATTLLSALALWTCVLLATAPTASAHAELARSTPSSGTRLHRLPAQITLVFSEGVNVPQTRVSLNSHRLPLRSANATATATTVLADTAAAPPAEHGGWTLTWRSVSADDGHVAQGQLVFHSFNSLNGADSPAAIPPPPTDNTVQQTLTATRLLGYLALTLYVGALVFLAVLWPQGATEDRRTRTLLTTTWLLGLLTALATIGLQGAYAAQQPLGYAFSAHTYATTLSSHLGTVLAARALLWLLAGVVLAALLQGGERAARSPGWRVGAAAIGFGLLRTTGMAGHSAEVAHRSWGAVADFVHLAGVSLWLGGLAVLLVGVLPRRRAAELSFVVPRYSALAMLSVLAITAAGIALAWQLLGSAAALVDTHYGRLLLLKIALLVAVLLIAQRSRIWTRHRLDIAVLLRGHAAAVRPFVYSVAAETGIVLLVLTAASLLVTSDPGR